MYVKIDNKKNGSGFTLIELLVTISIMLVITVGVVFNYSASNESLAVTAAVQQMSVDIRLVQVYGLSVKESAVGGGDFGRGYGVYATLDDQTNYYLFVDKNSNGKYDGTSSCTPGGECIEKVSFKNGIKISNICGAAFGGSLVCPPNSSVRGINITFVRPNTDAIIRYTTSAGAFYGGVFQTGRINFISPKNSATGMVTVENTGQISVQ